MKTLLELNAYSAQSVAYDDQGTGAQTLADRYQINGLIDTAQPVLANIERICSAAGSWLSYDIHEGKWGVVINSSGTSIASFSDTNIIGNISLGGTGLTDLYNSVKVEFPHRELRDSADFYNIEIPDVDRNANEEDNALNLAYDIINEPIQAQLLGFIELKQSRIDLIIKFQTDFTYINLKAGDIIDVTNSRFGFIAKKFRIITVTEITDDIGLRIEITALEYDPNVYSTADLYRYTRTDENGIVTIGSIGIPGTPNVTKFERSNRPRIVTTSAAPTGVVEGLEFWLTNDVNLSESNRTYRLIATVRPVTGNTFTSGQNVQLEYDALQASNFLIKTRGFNATTTGPFSSPSGLIEFVPVQQTDAITPETQVLSSTGELLTLYGASFLVNQLSNLLLGNTASVSSGSIFDSVFKLFKDETGVDLVGEASSGTLVVAASIGVQDEGISLTTQTSTINFVGPGVTATNAGSVVTVTIGGAGTGTTNAIAVTSVSPSSGPTTGGTTATIFGAGFSGATSVKFGANNASSFTVNSPTSITATTPPGTTGTVSVNVTTPLGTNAPNSLFTYTDPVLLLNIIQKLPPDRATYYDPVTGATSDTAPQSGSYYIAYGNQTFYGPLTVGSGNVKLYESDGTLVETVSAGSLTIDNNIVGIPFSSRNSGTDYYILMDQGVVAYCNYQSPAITSPFTWNFNTPLFTEPAYAVPTSSSSTVISIYTATVSSVSPSGSNNSKNSTLSITYNYSINKGSGNVYIKDLGTNATVATLPVSGSTKVGSSTLNFGSISAYVQNSGTYYVNADAGAVVSNMGGDCYSTIATPSAALTSTNFTFNIIGPLVLTSFSVFSDPFPNDLNKVNPQTNIKLIFNRYPQFGTIGGNFTLYKADGSVYQVFDIDTNFPDDKTSEIIWISENIVFLNPTIDLTLGETFYVQGTVNSLKDSFGNNWAGLSDTTTVRFKVDPGPTATFTPITSNSQYAELTFDRQIEPGTGNILIYDQLGNVVATLPATDPAISFV